MPTLKRLLGFFRPYAKTLLLSVLLLIMRAGAHLVPPLVQRAIIDDVIGDGRVDLLAQLAGLLVGVLAIRQLLAAGDMYVRHAFGERFILDLRVHLYAYLQRLSLSFFQRTSTGELMSRVTNDINALEHFVTHGFALALVDLLRLVGAAAVLFWLDWRLAAWVLIPVPALAISMRRFNSRIRPVYRQVRDRLGDINARLQDSLSGIKVIQAFGREDDELDRFAAESEGYFRARVQGIRYWTSFFPAMGFLAALGSVLVLAVGATRVLGGAMTLGTLVAFLTYVTSFYEPINRLTEIDNVFQQAIAAGERIFELLDTEPEIVQVASALSPVQVRGEIQFHQVSFRYDDYAPSSLERPMVLQDVSFEIRPGQTVALVGPSGAGKTSIANLICRFYDPNQGRITLDGHDLKDLALHSLRDKVAVVLQDTFLFNTTIRENLVYGRPDADQTALEAAAGTTFAHEFIQSLPNGYDTEIGERGVRLSGGQKQRLALARAILADPVILILDEATSSVDAEAEYLIQQALVSVLRGRTALVIAHRLSTIRNADKIIALEDGRVREIGDHTELMSRGGLYSQLYQRQLELTASEESQNGS